MLYSVKDWASDVAARLNSQAGSHRTPVRTRFLS
jgi:hypothetical protein